MNLNKKKILILTDWFYPGYKAGGPIQSTVNFSLAIKAQFDVCVLTTDTDFGASQPYENITADHWSTNFDKDIPVCYLRKANLTLKHISTKLLEAKADYIYLNHLFSPLFVVYPLWLKFTGQLKATVVLCPRGALYNSALAVKPFKKKVFIQLLKWLGIHRSIRFHATNEREREAIERFFPGSSIFIANNLVKMRKPSYISCVKEKGSVKCIFIARIVAIKNLLYLLEILKGLKNKVSLTVVGPAEDAAYLEKCEKLIQQLPDNIKVSYKGAVPNEQLTALIQEHHVFVLPTTGENFGHSIFEAFLAARPVLISDQTPWLGLTAKKLGWDLPLNNPAAFGKVLEELGAMEQDDYDKWTASAYHYAGEFIRKQVNTEPYLQLFTN